MALIMLERIKWIRNRDAFCASDAPPRKIYPSNPTKMTTLNQQPTIRRGVLPAGLLSILSLFTPANAATTVYNAAGANAAAIQGTVDSFRAGLGTLNPNVASSFGSGRREINWDGVPDALAAPNNLPGNFFNVNSPRGVVFSTPGTGFQVSANAGITPVKFGNIDPNYPDIFATFSAQRLFTSLGSTITDVTFFVPGSTVAAVTRGFGAVFSDVDLANLSSVEYFDSSNVSLGNHFVQNVPGNQTLSFLGVTFDAPVISRVRITSGNQILAFGNAATDIVVMDDFIYGEPVQARASVPDSGATLTLLGIALGGLGLAARKSGQSSKGSVVSE